MADQEPEASPTDGNGGAVPDPAKAPQLRILNQYVKDLSFENPNSPASLTGNQDAPKIEASVDVQAKKQSVDTDFEVLLKITVSAKRGETVAFIAELQYGGVFRLQNIPDEQKQPVVLIECPRQLFPFARRVIADTIRDGGYPPLLLDPIDFVALYQQQMKARAAQTGSAEKPSE
jgi:preprotein translocase subunit SecB